MPQRIPVGDRDLLATEVLAGQLDREPVSERGHCEVRDVAKCLLIVERGNEHPAGLGEHAGAQLGCLDRRHVLDHGDSGDSLVIGIE